MKLLISTHWFLTDPAKYHAKRQTELIFEALMSFVSRNLHKIVNKLTIINTMMTRELLSARSILFTSFQPVRASRHINKKYLTVKARASTEITMKKHYCDLWAPLFSEQNWCFVTKHMNVLHASYFKQPYKFNIAFSVGYKQTWCCCAHGSWGSLNLTAKRFSSREQQAHCTSIELADCSCTPLGNTLLFILDLSTSFFHSWEQTISPRFIPQAFRNRPPLVRLHWAVRVVSLFPPNEPNGNVFDSTCGGTRWEWLEITLNMTWQSSSLALFIVGGVWMTRVSATEQLSHVSSAPASHPYQPSGTPQKKN